jgi:hypothetical protein
MKQRRRTRLHVASNFSPRRVGSVSPEGEFSGRLSEGLDANQAPALATHAATISALSAAYEVGAQ